MRIWTMFGIWLALWQGGGVLLGQAQPCLGGDEDPYLTSAPRPQRREGVPYQFARPMTVMEIGFRQVTGDRASAKFLEYRDVPRGIFINNLISCAEVPGGGFYYRLRSRETLEMDQHSLLTAGLPGRFKVTATWDRTLHTLSTNGRNHFTRTGPGEFTLPEGLQALLGTQPVNLLLKRNTAGVGVALTPTEAWDVRLHYSLERRSGFRPVGANFAFSVVELPEPIDYRTHKLKLTTEFAREKWLVQVGSRTSIFDSGIDALEWTNPLHQAGDASTPERGRRGLPPDNAAQTFSLAGAVDLSRSVRVVATISPGWMTQDAPFLPFTSNAEITARSDYPMLPAASLDGRKQTLMMNYLLTGKVGKQFVFNARYRSYDLENETPSLVFSNYVRYDSSLPSASRFAPQARRSLPYGYRKQSVNLDWIWEPDKISSAKAFYKWEGWDRQYRDVSRSNEHTIGGSWDLSPDAGPLLRASFQHSLRDPRSYEARFSSSSFPDGMGFGELDQAPGLRRFDQARRSRNFGEVLVETTPSDFVTFSAAYTVDRSFFGESDYGLLHDLSDAITMDAAYVLTPSISVFGDYAYERFRYAQRSRERLSGSFTAPAVDSADNDWESSMRDRIHTWGAGVNASVLNDMIDVDLYWSLSHSQSRTKTTALGSPAADGFLANTAEDYPDTSDRFQQWVVSVRVPLGRGVSQKVQYTYERFGERDPAAEQASPLPGLSGPAGSGSIFLGPLFHRYRVHVLSYALSFVF